MVKRRPSPGDLVRTSTSTPLDLLITRDRPLPRRQRVKTLLWRAEELGLVLEADTLGEKTRLRVVVPRGVGWIGSELVEVVVSANMGPEELE